MPNDKTYQVDGFEYVFVRRRYSNRTFTWLHWRKDALHSWETFQDPWPKVKLSKSDLAKAIEAIKAILAAREEKP